MTCARHVCLGVLWVVLLGTGCTFVTLGITSRDWIQNENASIPVVSTYYTAPRLYI